MSGAHALQAPQPSILKVISHVSPFRTLSSKLSPFSSIMRLQRTRKCGELRERRKRLGDGMYKVSRYGGLGGGSSIMLPTTRGTIQRGGEGANRCQKENKSFPSPVLGPAPGRTGQFTPTRRFSDQSSLHEDDGTWLEPARAQRWPVRPSTGPSTGQPSLFFSSD